MSIIDRFKARVARRATSVFKHARYPLEHTLEHRGDPGLCGPDSVSWEVIADPAAFVGGIRALLVQAAHPEVAAGVAEHSRYRQDPLGRLSRTSSYVTATTYGSMPEAERAVAAVGRLHRRVRGLSHRKREYDATAPDLAAWVHNALTDSFLETHRRFGRRTLSSAERDRFVREQADIGRLLGAAPIPETAEQLHEWVTEHPDAASSPASRDSIDFLHRPPLRGSIRFGHRIIHQGAAATIPKRLRRILGLRRAPGAVLATRWLVGFLRWALGMSPSWKLALVRTGAEVPEGIFLQPLPIESLEDWSAGE